MSHGIKYWPEADEALLVEASKGLKCPKCRSTNVKCVDSHPDGMNMNYAYDCDDCHEQWEGY